jgi:hypothetical protein
MIQRNDSYNFWALYRNVTKSRNTAGRFQRLANTKSVKKKTETCQVRDLLRAYKTNNLNRQNRRTLYFRNNKETINQRHFGQNR